ncbi:MAG: class I SAM-dependent methyltransferase [Pseudomonadota bacterium]
MTFKDHFSRHAADYARYRPSYPDTLFQRLAELAPARALAWDCATGNGQAAAGLARHFERVIATDASAEQIASAPALDGVEFRVAPAEASGLATASADLVTVGQSLHWFDVDAFYAEAARVLKPDGVLAVWCYALCRVTSAVDAVVARLYDDIVGPFWPPERRLLEAGYADLGFPEPRLYLPAVAMERVWHAADMLGYLATWSAVRRFQEANGDDPLEQIRAALAEAWGPGARRVTWPLTLLAWRVTDPGAQSG